MGLEDSLYVRIFTFEVFWCVFVPSSTPRRLICPCFFPLLRFCWAMIKIREEIADIAEGRVKTEDRLVFFTKYIFL